MYIYLFIFFFKVTTSIFMQCEIREKEHMKKENTSRREEILMWVESSVVSVYTEDER